MASHARCISFSFLLLLLLLVLVVSFSPKTQARESKFFSKLSHHHIRRKTQEKPESITQSPAVSQSLGTDSVEHGYGLYGRQQSKSTNVVGQVKHVEADTLPKKTFRDFVMSSYPNEDDNGWNGSHSEEEEEGNGSGETREIGNGYETTEGHRKGEKMYLVHGKYYYGYITGQSDGKENEKQGVNEYVEDENSLPEIKGNVNDFETEKQGVAENKYYVNGKYYTGYVTKSHNGMNEYVDQDENSFPESKQNGNEYEYEYEKQGNQYLVNGKYYNGYITGENGNPNDKQGHSNKYKTEKQEMGENKYLVNGKYYSGYVTKAENGNRYENENENERQEMGEYMEEEKGFPESEDKGNEYEYESEREREKQAMGGHKYLVNGKYYSGYVTNTKTGSGNENLGMSEYVEDENQFPQGKGKENVLDTKEQQLDQGEKKYFVNGKYYSGYVTGEGESRDVNNQDYSRHQDFNHEYGTMDEYQKEQEYMP